MGGLGGLEALGSGFPGTGHARSHTVSTAASRLSEKRGEVKGPTPLRTCASCCRRQVGGRVTCWERGIGCLVGPEALRPEPGFLSGDPDMGWSGVSCAGVGSCRGTLVLCSYWYPRPCTLLVRTMGSGLANNEGQMGHDGIMSRHDLGAICFGFVLPHYHSALRSTHGVSSLPFCTPDPCAFLITIPFLDPCVSLNSYTQTGQSNPNSNSKFKSKLLAWFVCFLINFRVAAIHAVTPKANLIVVHLP